MTSLLADDSRLKHSFEAVCERLRQPDFAEQWSRPVSDWVQRSDRRLPIPFLDRTVGEVMHTAYSSLVQTASVGPKKLAVLVVLIERAAAEPEYSTPIALEKSLALDGREDSFQPDLVTEVMWEKWRETVRRFELGDLLLGSIARSLSRLPSVLWRTRLETYLDQSLHQLRSQKTYGKKRVAVVLEVFHDVHRMLAGGNPVPRLNTELKSAFTRRLENWIRHKRQSLENAQENEFIEQFVEPLLAQLHLDLGDTYVELVRERLGVGAESISVRQQSQRHRVTRARIYQMLDECSAAMAVRWPSGKCQLRSLEEYLLTRATGNESTLTLLRKLTELFYPQDYEAVERHLRSQLVS